VPHILCGDSFFGVMHDNPCCHSWALWGNIHTDVGTSSASIDSGYASGYADYLFDGSRSRLQIISSVSLLGVGIIP